MRFSTRGKAGEIGDVGKTSVRLNYVRLLRVLADFVIRFSLELAPNYGQVQQPVSVSARCMAFHGRQPREFITRRGSRAG